MLVSHDFLATHIGLYADPADLEPVIDSLWTYNSKLPYAIDIYPPGIEKPWSFDRELGAIGIARECGIGDVTFCPDTIGRFVHLNLASDKGRKEFLVPRHPLVEFIGQTFRIVPYGHESDFLAPMLDVDIGQLRSRR